MITILKLLAYAGLPLFAVVMMMVGTGR